MMQANDLSQDTLSARALQEAIDTGWLGSVQHYFPEVDSTNSLLAEMAARGAETGTLVITDYQRRGKGRLGRRWEAPAATSLLFSLLFRPQWPARRAMWLTMMAGLAALVAIETHTELRAGLKWPNDVMLSADGEWHKTGGILLESTVQDGILQQTILGMGLNVNIPDHLLPQGVGPVTSLLSASGQPVSRLPLLALLLQRLEDLYEEAAGGDSPQPAWNERLITRDRPVLVTTATQLLRGVASGTDEWGRLLVRDEQGNVQVISAGDVTLREEPAQ